VTVVDTNVIAYLYLPGDMTPRAEKLLLRDPEWAAPLLWRSELRNILALYVRKSLLALDQALQIQREAESLLAPHEYAVNSLEVLSLANQSTCSAYDCEFVALANSLGVKLVTMDAKLRAAFPKVTASLPA
jgi:predicted nucleic acid-binding protein